MCNAARLALLFMVMLSSACSTLMDAGGVASDAGALKACQDRYRADGDRNAYNACVERARGGY